MLETYSLAINVALESAFEWPMSKTCSPRRPENAYEDRQGNAQDDDDEWRNRHRNGAELDVYDEGDDDGPLTPSNSHCKGFRVEMTFKLVIAVGRRRRITLLRKGMSKKSSSHLKVPMESQKPEGTMGLKSPDAPKSERKGSAMG